jgi:aminoglycoside 6'-N-acetyltransferase I
MKIRAVTRDDASAWCRLREKLYGEGSHIQDIAAFFAGTAAEPHAVFVAEAGDGELCAFAEVSKRQEYVEGIDTYPVAYLEGWYVEPEYRRKGLGTRLVQHAEAWALEAGLSAIGSDAVLGNEESLQAHKAAGFEVAATVVHLRKALKSSSLNACADNSCAIAFAEIAPAVATPDAA